MSKLGVDVAALKEPATTRVFKAWVEGWEKRERKSNDAVIEARFVTKYKNLCFKDPDSGDIFTVAPQNAEFHRKKGDRGWHLICEKNGGVEEEDNEAFTIELANQLIKSYPQADGVQVIHADVDEHDSDSGLESPC